MSNGGGFVSVDEIEEYNEVVTQTFKSDTQFYEFYNSYAHSKGFRKQAVLRDKLTKRVKKRKFTCSFEGYRRAKWFGQSGKKTKRGKKRKERKTLTRRGCMAMLEVQLCEQSGTWSSLERLQH